MNPRADTPLAPVAYYAPVPRARLSAGAYICDAIAALMATAILAIPLLVLRRFEKIFADFKLQLPAPTRLLMALGYFAEQAYAVYWVWLLPLTLPLLLARLSPSTRRRTAPILTLLAMLATVLACAAIVMPMMSLIEGITSTKK